MKHLRTKETDRAGYGSRPSWKRKGVYREGGWVRVVVEPARWRLP